jgi:hypothetical protein
MKKTEKQRDGKQTMKKTEKQRDWGTIWEIQ